MKIRLRLRDNELDEVELRENREDGRQVAEGFMQTACLGMRGGEPPRLQAVENRVSALMGNYVERPTGKHLF